MKKIKAVVCINNLLIICLLCIVKYCDRSSIFSQTKSNLKKKGKLNTELLICVGGLKCRDLYQHVLWSKSVNQSCTVYLKNWLFNLQYLVAVILNLYCKSMDIFYIHSRHSGNSNSCVFFFFLFLNCRDLVSTLSLSFIKK